MADSRKRQRTHSSYYIDAVSEFLCPVCLVLKDDELYQCKYGHIICSDCNVQLKKHECPTCRERYPAKVQRAWPAERLISKLPIDCEHCSQTMTREEFKRHQPCSSLVSMVDKCAFAREAIMELSRTEDDTVKSKIVDAALPSLVLRIDDCRCARGAIVYLSRAKDDTVKSKIVNAALPSLVLRIDDCEFARGVIMNLSMTEDDTVKSKIVDAALASLALRAGDCEYARGAIMNLARTEDGTVIVNAALPSLVLR